MIDNLKQYDDLKDSGLPWLGMIPVHWDVRRNGRLFVQRNETGYPDLPILEVSLKTGVRVRDFENSNRKQVMSDREKYKRARQGDIAYNMMRMWQGAVGTSPVDGLVSPAYIVAKPLKDTDSKYFQYLFRTDAYMNEVNKYSRGIVSDRNRLYWEDFKQMPSPFPPPDEQAAIVRFLDHADRRIRRYIRAKRKLIALLKEQKQAIIHRAVTRGLDPNVKLKPSGVEWLGDVPEHWEVLPLKRAFSSMEYGISDSGADDGTIPVLTMGNVRDGRVTVPQKGGVTSVEPRMVLHDNDLLFNRTNSAELVAKVGLFRSEDRPVTYASYLVRMRASQGNEPDFLNFLLNDSAFLSTARREAIPSLHQSNLNPTRYGRLPIPLPPSCEQQEIVKSVALDTSNINAAIDRASREIELINEYRIRLISDAVTGKLDVRDAAAALPNELEPVELDSDEFVDEEDNSDDAELDTELEEVEL